MKDVLYLEVFASCTFSPHPIAWLGDVCLHPSPGRHGGRCVHKRGIASAYITCPSYSLSRQSGVQGVKKRSSFMSRKPMDPTCL